MDHKHQASPDNLGNPPSLTDYAKHHRIHIDDVWRLIEDGALLARRIGEQIFILESRKQLVQLPLLKPEKLIGAVAKKPSDHRDYQDLEKSLLLFLSHNQATLEQISRLNEEMIQSKEELLTEKRQQIQYLNTELQRQEKVIRSLKQQIEDLEILTKTLGDRASQTNYQDDVMT